MPRKREPSDLVAARARQLPQSFSLSAQYQRERRPQARLAKVAFPGAVEADQMISALAQGRERTRQVLHRHDGNVFEGAGGRLRQHPGRIRAVAGGDDHRLDAERGGGAKDRAHIVWVGDLIEHEHESCWLDLFEFGRGKGIGFGQKAVVHGVGAKAARDRVRAYDLGLDG